MNLDILQIFSLTVNKKEVEVIKRALKHFSGNIKSGCDQQLTSLEILKQLEEIK